ncbi:hypothetical protein [Blastomonas sp. AAP53]|uniref:hypothetical protein n=1 Tax=Blastomonas sp. AAP53 TaxID=1248760 RepID=UPI00036AA148|nr:hypothetical protein [Blastomonas sp. AAP53]
MKLHHILCIGALAVNSGPLAAGVQPPNLKALTRVAQQSGGQSAFRNAGYDKVMACAGRVHGMSLASKDPEIKRVGQAAAQALLAEAKVLKPEKTDRELKSELVVAANRFLGAAIEQDRATQSQIEGACRAIGVG